MRGKIIHGPLPDGSYNLIGIDQGMFWIQGNATREQLEKLACELDQILDTREEG